MLLAQLGYRLVLTPNLPYGTVIVDYDGQVIYSGQSETPLYDQMAKERGR